FFTRSSAWTLGSSGLRYQAASSGGEIVARRLKNSLVVSFNRAGESQVPALATAAPRWITALSTRGMEPCPLLPLATRSERRGNFSDVASGMYFTLPFSTSPPPPSLSANSQSSLSQYFSTSVFMLAVE